MAQQLSSCQHLEPLRAVQDAALLQDMCGETWIPRSSLHHWRPLGSGAFAVVQQCELKLENAPGVSLQLQHGAAALTGKQNFEGLSSPLDRVVAAV